MIKSDVHSSLGSTWHHGIVFAKLNLKVEYPPTYEHVFWHYFRADNVSINGAVNSIGWEGGFANKSGESQVSGLNNLFLNIY